MLFIREHRRVGQVAAAICERALLQVDGHGADGEDGRLGVVPAGRRGEGAANLRGRARREVKRRESRREQSGKERNHTRAVRAQAHDVGV